MHTLLDTGMRESALRGSSLAIMALLSAGLLAVGTFTVAAAPVSAQSISGAGAVIRVTDESGLPLVGTRIVLTRVADGVERSTALPQSGGARFLDLSPGDYTVLAEQIGYIPKFVTGVTFRTDGSLEVPVTLVATPTPPQYVDTVAFAGGMLAGTAPLQAVAVSASRLNDFPLPRRRLVDLLDFSTAAGDGFSIEGLPGALTGLRLDGVSLSGLDGFPVVPGLDRGAATPISMLGHAMVVTTNPDVEWAGQASGSLDLFTATGRGTPGVDGYGRWAGAGLIEDVTDGVRPIDQWLEAGARWGAPIADDAAYASVGFEVTRQTEQALPASGVIPAGLSGALREAHDLPPSVDRSAAAISGFGSFTWDVSSRSRLEARAGVGIVPESSVGVTSAAFPVARMVEGSDFHFGTTLTSLIGRDRDDTYHEGRLGVERVSRRFAAADAFGQPGATWVGSDATVLGPAADAAREYSRLVVQASETFHMTNGQHQLKGGASVMVSAVDVFYGIGSDIRVADPARFAAGDGYVVRDSPATESSPGSWGGAVFTQDVWTPIPGLELLGGARFDFERKPDSFDHWSEVWTLATGLDNRAEERLWWRVSPRVGFAWDPGERHEWVVNGSAGIFSGALDPVLLADWLSGWGGARVYREFTGLEGWPVPGFDPRNEGLPTLTLLNQGYEPPRTVRADLGIARALGAHTTLRVSGAFRRTDFLPLVYDLNLNPTPTEVDQFGRPMIGRLDSRAGILLPEDGSWRRFGTFDRAFAVEMDGLSTYRGITADLEHELSGDSEVFASYTFSRTVDNLFGGGAYASRWMPAPLLPESVGDWAESTSDFDIPHRAVVGADLALPGPAESRFAVLYRFRSGAPFTAGFRSSVDANADGYFGNDPAYIDAALPGTAGVISAWSCLGDDAGGFATRNGCRADAVHTLDARLTVGILNSGRYHGALVVEGIDLLGAERGGVDSALYLVGPDPMLSRTGNVVNVPLVANENFGQPLESIMPGRMFRIGFRMEL